MTRKSTEERRDEIGRAMLQTMANHGYAKSSIQRVAETADVTPGLVHYHFDSKQDILLYVLDAIVDRQLGVISEQIDGESPPPEKLRAALRAFLATGDSARPDEVAAWVTIGAEAIRQPEVREAFSEALAEFREVFEEIIDEGLETGAFDVEDRTADSAAAAILSTIQGYYTTAAVDRESVPRGSAAPAAWAMVRGLLDVGEA